MSQIKFNIGFHFSRIFVIVLVRKIDRKMRNKFNSGNIIAQQNYDACNFNSCKILIGKRIKSLLPNYFINPAF